MGVKGGRTASTHCLKDGMWLISNEEVIEDIRTTLSGKFMENGYFKVSYLKIGAMPLVKTKHTV